MSTEEPEPTSKLTLEEVELLDLFNALPNGIKRKPLAELVNLKKKHFWQRKQIASKSNQKVKWSLKTKIAFAVAVSMPTLIGLSLWVLGVI